MNFPTDLVAYRLIVCRLRPPTEIFWGVALRCGLDVFILCIREQRARAREDFFADFFV